MEYPDIVEARRRLEAPPRYATLKDVDLDGDWVTPLQITSRSACGLVLVAKDYLDVCSAKRERDAILRGGGYCPGTKFRRVLFDALARAGLRPEDVYVTQALHLLTPKRSERLSAELVNESFRCVTRHELTGRAVVPMGGDAARACRVAKIPVVGHTDHPSRRRVRPEVLAERIGRELLRARTVAGL